jgi:hypothetical protein
MILSLCREAASAPITGLPRRFISDGHRDCVFGGMTESIGPMWSKTKTNPWERDQPPPAGRPRNPGKRTRREDHALLIVRDEFRPAIPRSGWSPPEPVSAYSNSGHKISIWFLGCWWRCTGKKCTGLFSAPNIWYEESWSGHPAATNCLRQLAKLCEEFRAAGCAWAHRRILRCCLIPRLYYKPFEGTKLPAPK